ncbi:inhibitor of growth proteins N-terminal histone-binding-domain-containing protein [Xylariaceae sp. FL0804]|nr:inhibitor of growth proteins N-terminal histone-binding-domain-containing protein [Xylariaceae sp. FL0804]
MPRDDLSIDFVKKMGPSAEAQDPAVILEDFIHRTANLPEEVRFIQDEIADKDRTYHDCIRTIEECDNRIQRWIRANGSHSSNAREAALRTTIRENFVRAERLADDKVRLSIKAQTIYDKHLRHLDAQIKLLSDRSEPGFTDPDEIPSLVRPSAANNSNTSLRVLAVQTATPLNPIHNNASPTSARLSNPQVRTAQSQAHISASAPTTPAASMMLQRTQRESSAGPGSGAPKRGPRASTGLGSLPSSSSGLARHSSLGPGTPKAGTPGAGGSRAGSAGPRSTTIKGAAATGPGGAASRKGTPGAGVGRKKPPTSKSTLSRVKRAAAGHAKGSPASTTADSELSDADSVTSSRPARSRAGSGTPVPHHHNQHLHHNHHHHSRRPHPRPRPHHSGDPGAASSGGGGGGDGDEDMADRDAAATTAAIAATAAARATAARTDGGDDDDDDDDDVGMSGSSAASGVDDDDDDDDEEEDEEGKKYCLCQHVSYGDMVACDNPDCPYEWFHWTCVGLKSEPEGRWYCPACTENMKRKGR